MTGDCHPDAVEKAQERGGRHDTDRPDRMDDVLDRAELGHEEGELLVEGCESYRDYPDPRPVGEPEVGDVRAWTRQPRTCRWVRRHGDARERPFRGGIPTYRIVNQSGAFGP